MIKIILPIIIIFVQTSKLTSQIISGTIVFGGIAKEGIIFVADSRVTHSINFIDQFYFDNVAKIHIIDNYVVGLSGNTSISNYEIEYYLDKIKNIKFSSKEEIIKHIHNLILVDTNFDITKKHDFKILIGGYNKNFF